MSRLPFDHYSKHKQPPTPQLLKAAANLLWGGGNQTKLRLASQLINAWKRGGTDSSIDAVQMSLHAAAAAGGNPNELLATLRGDPCFRVVQDWSVVGDPRDFVSLNAATLISKARSTTTTGVLTEELPPPTAYVAGKHPIRPGQPNCKQFVNFGQCAFNERCVWNHPGKPSGDQHKPKQQPSKNSSSSSTPAAPLVPAPPPSKPAWGGAGVTAAAARPPQQQQPSDQGATTNNKSSSNGTIQNTSGSSSQVDAAVPPSGAAHDQSAQQQPQQQVAALSKLPPGFATVHYKGRPCQLMMLRGCCPMGDKCPYDHPPRAGAAGQAGSTPAATIQQAVAPIISTDSHAAGQVDSPLSADAHQATPEAFYKPAAQHAEAAHPATSSAAAGTSTAAAAGSGESNAAGGLPQRPGEPNCPYYMGTGTCKFKEGCMFHHPPAAEHPECVLRGEMPRKYSASSQPPYGRLVQHLCHRVYDYESCVEAQLKVWLAKHVLNMNNPESHMFSSSAKRPAYPAKGKGFYWQQLGPYTCSMGEAGQVLHALWRAQPDDAASQPMPYTKQIRELLAGDPFWDCVPDPKCSSHLWVKLNVDKITRLLNF